MYMFAFIFKKKWMWCFCCEDILLCHDDELDTRRVAFALYLTPSWSKEDGGLLDLFDMDGLYARFVKEHVLLSLLP